MILSGLHEFERHRQAGRSAGAIVQGLVPTARTVRHLRHVDLRPRRAVRSGDLQRPAAFGSQGNDVRGRTAHHPPADAPRRAAESPSRRTGDPRPHGLHARRSRSSSGNTIPNCLVAIRSIFSTCNALCQGGLLTSLDVPPLVCYPGGLRWPRRGPKPGEQRNLDLRIGRESASRHDDC